MNHKLIAVLNGIRPGKELTNKLLDDINKEYNNILLILRDKALEKPNILKQFARHTYNQLVIKEKNLKYHHKFILDQIKNGMPQERLERLDEQRAILLEIFATISDAQASLLEHLVAYFPDEFGTEKHTTKLRELHPDSTVLIPFDQKIEHLKKQGAPINLTHNYELIKAQRIEQYVEANIQFENQRKLDKLTTTKFEKDSFYFWWLKGELAFVERLFADEYPNSQKRSKPSIFNQIEISKYQDYVNVELKKTQNKIEKSHEKQPLEKKGGHLTITQIALMHVYRGSSVTRKNGDEIAKEYGYKSGEKLFQKFTYYSSAANRKGRPQPCTPRKLKNKIQMFQKVIGFLTPDQAGRAKDELQILQTIHETEHL